MQRQCPSNWELKGGRDGKLVLYVSLDGRTGTVLASYSGMQIHWPYARGSRTLYLGTGAPWVMAFLALVFVAPFFDFRRWRRPLHLDLVLALGLMLSLIQYGRGKVGTSTPLAFAALGLLAARMVWLARHPGSRSDPLLPWIRPRALLVLAGLLLAGRVAFNIFAGHASDVGYFSVYGADSLLHGYSIYDSGSVPDQSAYGPAMHLAYVPFAALFPLPYGLARGAGQAAHAAAVTFDVLVTVALFALGRRLRPGPAGKALGAVLAFAWAANPVGFYATAWSANDGFIALALVLALLVVGSPPARGVFTAIAGAAKWVPFVLLPVFASGTRRPERRTLLVFALAVVITVAAAAWPFLPSGGIREIYSVSAGRVAKIQTPFSIWGLWHIPAAFRDAWLVLVAAGAVAAAWVPRTRTPVTIAAIATALLVLSQMGLPHWHYSYAAWFVPTALVAILARHERVSAAGP